MPNRIVNDLIQMVNQLQTQVIELKTDMQWMKRGMYLSTSVGLATFLGVIVKIVLG